MDNAKTKTIIELLTLMASVLLLSDSIRMFILYHYSNYVFLFQFPDIMLLRNVVFGSCGIIISILSYKGWIRYKIFIFLLFTICLGVLLNLLYA